MRVATLNINNINKRLDNLLAWLAKAQPDVVSLQELKAEQEAFPMNALIADFDAGPKSASGTSPRSAFLDNFRLADNPPGSSSLASFDQVAISVPRERRESRTFSCSLNGGNFPSLLGHRTLALKADITVAAP